MNAMGYTISSIQWQLSRSDRPEKAIEMVVKLKCGAGNYRRHSILNSKKVEQP